MFCLCDDRYKFALN